MITIADQGIRPSKGNYVRSLRALKGLVVFCGCCCWKRDDDPMMRAISTHWNYTSAVKIFHLNNANPVPLTSANLIPLRPETRIPGFLCQAARTLLNVSQSWLWQQADVSKKTINDFENGFLEPNLEINQRIRHALEASGAQFVFGQDVLGVVVYRSSEQENLRSRSTKRRER
jgi:DNA-binding XRE family transcriptional regulator